MAKGKKDCATLFGLVIENPQVLLYLARCWKLLQDRGVNGDNALKQAVQIVGLQEAFGSLQV